MKRLRRVLATMIAIGCPAVFGSGCAVATESASSDDSSALDESADAVITTTTILGCNLSGPYLTTDPRSYKVESKANVSSYRLKFTTSSATGTVNGKRPGVKGDGAFSGVNFVFPSGTIEKTIYVSPGQGNLWKTNFAGEGGMATSVTLLCL